jgi:hypothetical protein
LACENRCDAEGQLSLYFCIWQLFLFGLIFTRGGAFNSLVPFVCRSLAVFYFVVSNANFLVMDHSYLALHPLTLRSP